MNAMERLNKLVMKKGPLLAGLDPDIERIKVLNEKVWKYTQCKFEKDNEFVAELIWQFCYEYINLVANKVAAIKINIAFFEAYGLEELFWQVVETAKESKLFVIADVKRADIGNTSKKYAERYLEKNSPIDAITVNPYFGWDGVKPFLDMAKANGKGVFVLVKTSNQSSSEIQDLELISGRKVYQEVAELVKEWGEYTGRSEEERYSLVGAVVGATHPDDAKLLREQMPNTFFLVPGYGAQGATADDIAVNFDELGGGAIVNSSRGLMFAYEKEPWKSELSIERYEEAIEEAVYVSQEELMKAVSSNTK